MDTSIEKTTSVRTRFAWRAGYLLAAFGIYLADQASKAWAVKALRFGDERVIIPGFFQFIYTFPDNFYGMFKIVIHRDHNFTFTQIQSTKCGFMLAKIFGKQNSFYIRKFIL